VFYGLLELSVSLFNPFGHDDIDHDIGSFCDKANTEMMVIAKRSKASKVADTTDFNKVPHSAV
jgi:predicted membrane chloride channel (bestrophin family)